MKAKKLLMEINKEMIKVKKQLDTKIFRQIII